MEDWKDTISNVLKAVKVKLESQFSPLSDTFSNVISDNPWAKLFLILLAIIIASQLIVLLLKGYDKAFRQTIYRRLGSPAYIDRFTKELVGPARSRDLVLDLASLNRYLQKYQPEELELIDTYLQTMKESYRDYRPHAFIAGALLSIMTYMIMNYYSIEVFGGQVLPVLVPVFLLGIWLLITFSHYSNEKSKVIQLEKAVKHASSTKVVQATMSYIDQDLKKYKTEIQEENEDFYEVVKCYSCLYHENLMEEIRFQINDTVLNFISKDKRIEVKVKSEFGYNRDFIIDQLEVRGDICKSIRKGNAVFDEKLMVTYLNIAFAQNPSRYQTV
ncbi:hypothetical protein [Pseudalkalibacillus caeni]|uniref:Uncharacterized protein n=1 Tax=Exobacillus caeni TaxID=2574798 RepID=A0A5R9F5C9_9BACL|nr:hypothetical protein [Pseudalkalibacillus caeni]TLS35015.1 hypothetical protein FCL54_22710 [Pseudalkalibacillus caeni]